MQKAIQKLRKEHRKCISIRTLSTDLTDGTVITASYTDEKNVFLLEWLCDNKVRMLRWRKNGNDYCPQKGLRPCHIYYKWFNEKIHTETHLWKKNGKLHSINDQPAKKLLNSQKHVWSQKWYKNGKEHREDDKPSTEEFNMDSGDIHYGTIATKKWKQHGKAFRADNAPTSEDYSYCDNRIFVRQDWKGMQIDREDRRTHNRMKVLDITNNIVREHGFYVRNMNGETFDMHIHNSADGILQEITFCNSHFDLSDLDSNPAKRDFHPNGFCQRKLHMRSRVVHLDGDRPACVEWDDTGRLIAEHYVRNGVYFRENGLPSFLQYTDGVLVYSEHRTMQFVYHYYLVKTIPLSAVTDQSKECVVCYENGIHEPIVQTPCKHVGHQTCLNSWFERVRICPVCRKTFD